jgi:hypothetical protein
VSDCLAYYEALDKAQTQNGYQDFLQLTLAAESKAFNTVFVFNVISLGS